jgi:predicted DNA-binding helix-hairpin-helix protein
MGLRRKLGILAGAAKRDASCAPGGAKGRDLRRGRGIGPIVGTGICHRGRIHLESVPEVGPDLTALAGRCAGRLSRTVGCLLRARHLGPVRLADLDLARLGAHLRRAAPFPVTPDHRSRGPVAPPRQPEPLAHA